MLSISVPVSAAAMRVVQLAIALTQIELGTGRNRGCRRDWR